ncbi:MAG: ABC transporter permease [Puniceicoccales bacterium]|jgi:phospholipid/cholesterol/gamma-HCH transport system permease protein|nr:ABC transporter permease [Puniceicoccales bacterium]
MQEIFNSSTLHVYAETNAIHFECLGFWDLTQSIWDFKGHIPKNITKIIVDVASLQRISSPFLVFLDHLKSWAKTNNMALEMHHLPQGVEKIFSLSQTAIAAPTKSPEIHGFFYYIGKQTIDFCSNLKEGMLFFLSLLKSLVDIAIAPSKNKAKNLLPFLQQTGSNALPIVTLISALVGLIMAFVSVVQLERFGASIYVADLVALAMTREMGCLMTGFIMAGRTGAAFAASIGSMQANEELDALQTFGINRMAYLVAPRVTALALMMPLLCIFADLIGIVGGMLSALPFTNSTLIQYLLQTKKALVIGDILIGLVKSIAFGVIIAAIGCYKGMRCGRNAAAVGEATTSAVVQGITGIIIADALFAILFTTLGV